MVRQFMFGVAALALVVTQASGQVVNGDFEAGNSGFSTQYAYAPSGNSTEGQYTVRTDPQNWNRAFASFGDHTSGIGNMLVVNGATTGNPYLWQQTVTIDPLSNYDFSAWIATAVGGGPADLLVEINGLPLGTSFTAPDLPGSWANWIETWASGSATTADIRIFNTDQSTYPNDFYVDDISLSFTGFTIPEPTCGIGFVLMAMAGLVRRRSVTLGRQ